MSKIIATILAWFGIHEPRGEALIAKAAGMFTTAIQHLENAVEDILDDIDDSEARENDHQAAIEGEIAQQRVMWEHHDRAQRLKGKLSELVS